MMVILYEACNGAESFEDANNNSGRRTVADTGTDPVTRMKMVKDQEQEQAPDLMFKIFLSQSQ